jgi:hypothetical protein
MLTEEATDQENKAVANVASAEDLLIIKAKLMHAKNATLMCILEFEKLLNEIEPDDYMNDLKDLIEFVSLWDGLLSLLDGAEQIEAKELSHIHNHLSNMPQLIRKHYDTLIFADSSIEDQTTSEPLDIAFV